jgi:Tfp pilus assembly protein PilP
MRQRRSSGSGWTRLVAALFASLLAAAAWAQSQPKFPVPLPTPKAPAPSTAPDPTPAPAAPAAPAAGAPATTGPRDPFEPLVRKPEPGEERRMHEIANLKLVGVMWDPKDTKAIRALVQTPDGLGYYLRLNEEKFGGKVVAVERDRVRFVVREEVPGAGSRERTVELRLSKPDGQ